MHVSVKRALWIGSIVWLASACQQSKNAEGPMERAGKNVDRAAKKTGQAVEKAAKKTGAAAERAAEATGDALQEAGKKLKGDETRRPAEKTK
jgi:hypothetical protein